MPNDEDDFSDEEIDSLQQVARENIESFASEYINKFHADIVKCKTIYEYYSLMVSVMVFRDLAISQLSRELEKLDTDPNEIIEQLESMATDISGKVVAGFIHKSMN